ncbi:1-phosphofructokinase [Mycoplasma sp. 6243]|uniref:1-phosphofructokinase n=1 Tax=Mycoplasma sp. 6243 TaxID=3440865 RepID=UPI003EB9441C
MIYTLTLSPSIDLFITSENFDLKKVNRYGEFEFLPGGKGLNASVVLKRHGFDNKAITFFDSQTFDMFQKDTFSKEKLDVLNIVTEQKTRINIKYYGKTTDFELNGPKTLINADKENKLFKELDKITKDDVLMLMGKADEELLLRILEFVSSKNIKVVLDIESSNFINFLQFKPFLIKPNIDELKMIFASLSDSVHDIKHSMQQLQNLGAENVIVSNGEKGAYLLDSKQNFYSLKINQKVDLVSATGAGDTMISIFAASYLKNNNSENAFLLAGAASMATVTSKWLANKKETKKFLSNVFIQK